MPTPSDPEYQVKLAKAKRRAQAYATMRAKKEERALAQHVAQQAKKEYLAEKAAEVERQTRLHADWRRRRNTYAVERDARAEQRRIEELLAGFWPRVEFDYAWQHGYPQRGSDANPYPPPRGSDANPYPPPLQRRPHEPPKPMQRRPHRRRGPRPLFPPFTPVPNRTWEWVYPFPEGYQGYDPHAEANGTWDRVRRDGPDPFPGWPEGEATLPSPRSYGPLGPGDPFPGWPEGEVTLPAPSSYGSPGPGAPSKGSAGKNFLNTDAFGRSASGYDLPRLGLFGMDAPGKGLFDGSDFRGGLFGMGAPRGGGSGKGLLGTDVFGRGANDPIPGQPSPRYGKSSALTKPFTSLGYGRATQPRGSSYGQLGSGAFGELMGRRPRPASWV